MSTTDPKDIPCPWCQRVNDAHNAIGDPDAAPETDDISLCMSCGQWALFCVHPDGRVHLKRPQSGVEYAHIVSVLEGVMS